MPAARATTFNCLRAGGETLVVEGTNFGVAGARVAVGGAPCGGVEHDARVADDAP